MLWNGVILKAQYPQVIQPGLLHKSSVWLRGLVTGADNVDMCH